MGVGAAIAWFTRREYTVCIPLTDSQKYDLIVERDGRILRVQVKTTTRRAPSGSWEVAVKTCGGNRSGRGKISYFNHEDAEVLFILASSGEIWIIETNKDTPRSSIKLGKEYDKYKAK